MRRTRIKICGVTSVDVARAAIDAGADAIGCVFAEGSPRRIDLETASKIVDDAPSFVSVVGVFQLTGSLDRDLESWRHMSPYVQLHGDEDESLAKLVARRSRVIRGFRFEGSQVRRWDGCPHVDALLIDGAIPGGGRGFRHDRLASMMPDLSKPVILAGGLDPSNVGEAIAQVQPFGVDVSSGVESKPGVKDIGLIRAFCRAIAETDRAMRMGDSS